MRGHFGIGGIVTESSEKESREAQHGVQRRSPECDLVRQLPKTREPFTHGIALPSIDC